MNIFLKHDFSIFSGGLLAIFSSILFNFNAIRMAKLSIVSFIIQVIVCDYFLNLFSDPVHQVPLTLSDSFHSARSFLLLVDFKKKKRKN